MEPAEAGNIPLIVGDLGRRSTHVLQLFHQSRHLKIYPQPKHLSYFSYSRFGGRVPLVLRDEDAWTIFLHIAPRMHCVGKVNIWLMVSILEDDAQSRQYQQGRLNY